MPDPGAVGQAGIVALGQRRQVFGARQFAGDHGPPAKGQAIALQAPGHHFGSGDAPLVELLEVLPFGLDPRPAQVTAHVLAGPGVALDVVIDPVTLDTHHLADRVAGQALALQGKYRFQAAEVRRQVFVAWRQCPPRHQSASP
ncbi:hypothetical protein D3C75_1046270 [compost metagenome]